MDKLYGAFFNFVIVIIGSLLGMLLKKGVPERIEKIIMQGMALCVLYIGISGAFDGENILIAIISIALGSVIGELIDIDKHINNLGKKLENAVNKNNDSKISVAQGFVTATLLYCVGAMAIVGSINSGLSGDHSTLIAKSWIDGIVAVVLASSLGIGVMFSSISVLLYQGLIVILAQFIQPILTPEIISEMTAVGSLLIIGLSINMLKLTNIKVMNMIPAIFIPIILCRFM